VLDGLLPSDDPARTICAYVATLNLDGFLASVRAVEGVPGRNGTDPQILVALWMCATLEGIGSARLLARLCQRDIRYRWVCGGVTVNYHLLSDFRTNFATELEDLLKTHVAALMSQGLVQLNRVAQDGMRVRAAAGSGSFRRAETLEACAQDVAEQLAVLKQQVDEPTGEAARRSHAARVRHAQEKLARIQQARAVATELEAKRQARHAEHPSEAPPAGSEADPKKTPRGSTTDPEARRMKMPDGGYRPAYNVQAATTTAEGIIVGVDVTAQGTDSGLLEPMLAQIQESYGQKPKEALTDGGYVCAADVEAAAAAGVAVYMPLKNAEKELAAGTDPYAPKRKDRAGMAALRARMGTEEGKAIYKQRAATAEWVNAGMRNRGLYRFLVRGLTSVRAVVIIQALVHNLFQTIRLCKSIRQNELWTDILRDGLAQGENRRRTRETL
jgi:transposase